MTFEAIFENYVFLFSNKIKLEVFSWFFKKTKLSQISKEKNGS